MLHTERFKELEKIGKGTYGEVFKAYDAKFDQVIALKKMFIQNEEEGIPSTVLREISLLKGMKHPNIVDLKDIVLESGKVYLVFEYLKRDLKNFLDSLPQDTFLEEKTVKVG